MRLGSRGEPFHVPDLLIQRLGAVVVRIELTLRGGERPLDKRPHRRVIDAADASRIDGRRGRRWDDAVDVAQAAHVSSSGMSMTTRRFSSTAAPALSSAAARAIAR